MAMMLIIYPCWVMGNTSHWHPVGTLQLLPRSSVWPLLKRLCVWCFKVVPPGMFITLRRAEAYLPSVRCQLFSGGFPRTHSQANSARVSLQVLDAKRAGPSLNHRDTKAMKQDPHACNSNLDTEHWVEVKKLGLIKIIWFFNHGERMLLFSINVYLLKLVFYLYS